MSTARVLITDSLYLLRVIAAEETPAAYQLQDGLRFLNRFLHGLKAKNADMGFQDITLDDSLPVPPEMEEPIMYVLAAKMAPLYGTQLTPEVAVEAKEAMTILQSYYGRNATLTVDEAYQERSGRHIYYSGDL